MKTNPLVAVVAHKLFDVIGMQGRTMRAAVNLGFDPRHTNTGEGNPLTPADNSV